MNKHIKTALADCRSNFWTNKLKLLNVKDQSLWSTLKSIRRKRVPAPPLILPDQSIAYEPLQKAEAIAKNFYQVYKQTATLTSPLSPVVDDYISRLVDEMVPPLNTFTFTKIFFSVAGTFCKVVH